ncbi:MAG: hypothetical protein COV45_01505 [Deltaproteobacteria bacterium CG11_big_fil_rev_8_21_14_0_20_47_16]|nr:MAG: hypothetical protein COV45_01505 [Deltaproteobacteria bacterium CG11_big_fil_rev_8_21_14_0_20_47_16]
MSSINIQFAETTTTLPHSAEAPVLRLAGGDGHVAQAIRQVTNEFLPIVSESRAMQDVLQALKEEEGRSGPVVFVGESGSGKQFLARHLHSRCSGAAGPYLTIDARRMAVEAIDQILLGYWHKPLFGKAEVIPGMLAEAAGGTLVIRGFETVPWRVQELLVPVVTDGHYQPLNVQESLPVQCRIVFVFESAVFPRSSEKVLAPQLWEALKDRVVQVPTLQARRDDVLPLAEYFLNRQAQEWGQPRRELSTAAQKVIKKYRWPGNVKELQWAMATAMTSTSHEVLDVHHFPPQLAAAGEVPSLDNVALEDFVEQKLAQFLERVGSYDVSDLHDAIETQMERPLYKLVLQHTNGNQIKAARILGINRNTLRTKLRKYGLK